MRGASGDGGRLGWEASVMRAANPRPKAAPAASSSYRRTDVRRVVADWGFGHRHTDTGQLPRPRQEEFRDPRDTYEEECAAACCRRHEAASEGCVTTDRDPVYCESLPRYAPSSRPHRLLGRVLRSRCVVSLICFARRCRWSRLAGSSQVSCAATTTTTTTPANGAGREARILNGERASRTSAGTREDVRALVHAAWWRQYPSQ